jgi:hypothetical protein
LRCSASTPSTSSDDAIVLNVRVCVPFYLYYYYYCILTLTNEPKWIQFQFVMLMQGMMCEGCASSVKKLLETQVCMFQFWKMLKCACTN